MRNGVRWPIVVVILVSGLLAGAFGCTQPGPAPAPSPKLTTSAPSPVPAPASSSASKPTVTPTAATPAKAETLPQMLKLGCYGLGSTGYASAAAVFPSITRRTGMTVRLVPGGTDMARVIPLRGRDTQIAYITEATAYYASSGLGEFDVFPEWGPQRLQLVYRCHNLFVGGMVRADSGIKEPKDIKGKRVIRIPGSTTQNAIIESILAYGGLTWKDVTPVDYPTYSAATKGPLEGTADMCFIGPNDPAAIELAASPHGCHLLSMPNDTPEQKEAWKRLQAVCPYFSPGAVPKDWTKVSEPSITRLVVSQYSYDWLAYDWQDEYLVYRAAKAVFEGYSEYKDAFQVLADWIPERHSVEGGLNVNIDPAHPGYVRFLKEAKLWTPEHDKWQADRLKRADLCAQSWEKALTLADQKKIKVPSPEWSKFWSDYLYAELGKAGFAR